MPLKHIENTFSSKETNVTNKTLFKSRLLRHNRNISTEDLVEEQENIVTKQDDFDELFPEKIEEKKRNDYSPRKPKAQDLIYPFDDEKASSSQSSSIQLPHTFIDEEPISNPHLIGLDLTKNEIVGSNTFMNSSILITKKIKTSRITKNTKKVYWTGLADSSDNVQLVQSTSTEFIEQPEFIGTNDHVETKTVTRKRKASQSPPPEPSSPTIKQVVEEQDQDNDLAIENENKHSITLFEEEDNLKPVIKINQRSNAKKNKSKSNESDISEVDENETEDVYEFRSGANRRKRRATTKNKVPVVKLIGEKIKPEKASSAKPPTKRKGRSSKRDLIQQDEIEEKMRQNAKELSEIKKYKLVVEKVQRESSDSE